MREQDGQVARTAGDAGNASGHLRNLPQGRIGNLSACAAAMSRFTRIFRL